MCGICGMLNTKHRNQVVLQRMLDALIHRGPDSQGIYEDRGFLAGMRRLAINDVNGGHQPLYNTSRNVVLLYNGEIYNSPALRKALESEGVCFATRSDGEVICHLYERHGLDTFAMLDGMFACALWDCTKQRLILARDIPGEKPLYYSKLSDGGIIFASELKSLMRHPSVSRELNKQALWDFPTFLWIPEPETVFCDVYAVEKGSLLIIDEDDITQKKIPNNFGPNVNLRDLNIEDAAIITRQVVEEAIVSRLLSDVPVGSFLSGGLDSSIICTVASRVLSSLSTFTVGFEDCADPYHGRADESAQAAELAHILGTKHTTVRVRSSDFRQCLRPFCKFSDQPFAVSSGLGVYAIAKVAKELGISVLLTGDGADEAFGGYSWYSYLESITNMPPIAPINKSISFQNTGLPVEKRLSILAGYPPELRAWAWHYYASETEKQTLFCTDWQEGLKSSTRFFAQWGKADWEPEDYIRQDQAFYFPFEMLRKADRMTMAHSVEGRVPFAAPAVQRLAEGISMQQMIKGDTLKYLLRKAFADILPETVTKRPKHGFNVPIDAWLKGEWKDLLSDAFAQDSALTKYGLLDKNAQSVAFSMLMDPTRLNGHTLFCYIVLNIWLEEFFHGIDC